MRYSSTTLTMKQIFPIFGLIFLLSSCIKNNPDPVWIEINEWTLEANPNSAVDPGILTENISDVWVYIDNEFVGVFEVPCKIPVLYSGTKSIVIYPVILNNGISATKKIYPFLEEYSITADLIANQTVTIDPTTRYLSTTQFWIEDFEGAGNKMEDDPTTEAQFETSSDPNVLVTGINGNKFGRVTLSTALDTWVAYSKGDGDELSLPKGSEVYLEIDYHNTNRVTTGLLAVSPSGNTPNPNIQLNPQDDGDVQWKKIYIDLREIVSGSATGSNFRLTFQALLDEEATSGEINIDNIKVLYF